MDNPLVDKSEAKKTRERIMIEAAVLFAHRGYAAVSMRDIAARVKIKPAAIYNYFKGKEALFDVIVGNIEDIYLKYYVRLEKRIEGAVNFDQVLDCLFAELMDVYHIFIYYGISLITAEQFGSKKARDAFNNILIKKGIEYSKKTFDMCVEKGWVKEFDTAGLATIFMNSVMIGTLMRTHEHMKHKTAYNSTEMFESLRRHLRNSVEITQ